MSLEGLSREMRLSLNCPLSGTRMQLPVRGRNCQHVACVDYASLIQFYGNGQRPWTCPLCKERSDQQQAPQPLSFDTLEIDSHINCILRALSRDNRTVTEVLLDDSGGWQLTQDCTPPNAKRRRAQEHSPGAYHSDAALLSPPHMNSGSVKYSMPHTPATPSHVPIENIPTPYSFQTTTGGSQPHDTVSSIAGSAPYTPASNSVQSTSGVGSTGSANGKRKENAQLVRIYCFSRPSQHRR